MRIYVLIIQILISILTILFLNDINALNKVKIDSDPVEYDMLINIRDSNIVLIEKDESYAYFWKTIIS